MSTSGCCYLQTFKPSDFDADVTKDETTARFFVLDGKIKVAQNTVALSGPFYGTA